MSGGVSNSAGLSKCVYSRVVNGITPVGRAPGAGRTPRRVQSVIETNWNSPSGKSSKLSIATNEQNTGILGKKKG